MRKIRLISCFLVVSLLFSACAKEIESTAGGEIITTTVATTTEPVVTTEPIPAPVTVKVTAAGDNLIHSSIYNQAHKRSENGTYDFGYAYENIRPLICGDLNILNQETPICNDVFEPSTYPCFNSPTQLGNEMLDIGFNAFCHANNHILDKGMKGVEATLDYWADKDAVVYGAYRNEEDMNNIRTRNINGITFSFLGFTEHTNGIRIPEDSEIEVIYTEEIETIEKQIKSAREQSDVVVVSVHWGVENSHIITDAQRNLAQQMADWGADVIIGTHPHVVQDMDEITAADGRNVLVMYSLGNFISAQSVGNRMIGGVVDFNVTKNFEYDSIMISDVKFIPVITHYDYNYSNVRVYPLSQYTRELASNHGIRANSHFDYDFIIETLKENINERYLVLENIDTEEETEDDAA